MYKGFDINRIVLISRNLSLPIIGAVHCTAAHSGIEIAHYNHSSPVGSCFNVSGSVW